MKALLYSVSLISMFLSALFTVNAQPTLTRECNEIRPGDCLLKQQIEYQAPGGKGENILWDFSRQTTIDGNYELKYCSYDDSLLIGQENRTLYKYILQGDTLLSVGFENPTTLISNRKPELFLVYPVYF